ncbi:site-specific recombinase, phage integrase family [Ostertagia ostertagi]
MPSHGRARTRRVEDGEADRLEVAINRLRNTLMRAVIRFALATGMRRGEILKLRVEHIDRLRRTLHIPESKNGHPRTIPLTSCALRILDEVQPDADGYMFPVSPNSVRLAWERVRRNAKLPDMHFHDLRHEAISRFFEKGLSVPEVALISGHRDVRMLFRYTHLKAEDVAARLDALEKLQGS